MALLRKLLAVPAVYRLFGRMIGGNARANYVRDYIQPVPGERVLDIGCGPADILAHLPDVRYVGIDLSPDYIAAAKTRFGHCGEFLCEDVADLVVREPGAFDLVMANGLLHHLDDMQAAHFMNVARQALKPGGRLVTLDGCWVPGQSRIARYLLRKDRGKFVRHEAGYLALARQEFKCVAAHIRHNLLRLPYTHIIMICRADEVGGCAQPARGEW